jgi:hypothetical protein
VFRLQMNIILAVSGKNHYSNRIKNHLYNPNIMKK